MLNLKIIYKVILSPDRERQDNQDPLMAYPLQKTLANCSNRFQSEGAFLKNHA